MRTSLLSLVVASSLTLAAAAPSPALPRSVESPALVTRNNGSNITYSSKGATKDYPVTVNGIHLLTASAKELSAALAAGTVTSVQLVDAYFARIAANNHEGLNLRAIIETAPTAREIAQQLDDKRAAGEVLSPLHGIPIAVKDNYNTDPSLLMNTTAGSYSLLGQTTAGDAFVVQQLREAGVIILAKANLDEFSGERGSSNAGGWSARGGQMSAAYVEGGFAAGGDPSGSSGGPGIVSSAGFAAFSLGSDTEGSITNPSNNAALYGLRPSTGLTSRTGVVPISSSQDTTGPLAKSVWDVAAALSIMAKTDTKDDYSFAAIPYRKDDYLPYLDVNGLKGLRIGIPREPYFNATYTGLPDFKYTAFEEAIEKVKAAGASVKDVKFHNPERLKYSFVGAADPTSNNGTQRVLTDVKDDMAHYLQIQLVNSTIRTLLDIVNFNDANSELEFPPGKCCQGTFIAATGQLSRNENPKYWLAKYEVDRLYTEEIAPIYAENDIDVLLFPTEAGASRLGAVGRMPIGTVPVGQSSIGLPFGLSFAGKPYDEPTVIRAMSGWEAVFPPRPVPSTLD